MFGLLVRKPRMFNFETRSRALSAVGAAALFLAAPAVAKAAACSIEADGETVYARVQQIVKTNMFKAQDVSFASYSKINIELLPNCVFKLDGKFSVKTAKVGQIKFKHFDAEFTRKDGAPMGFKKLKPIVE